MAKDNEIVINWRWALPQNSRVGLRQPRILFILVSFSTVLCFSLSRDLSLEPINWLCIRNFVPKAWHVMCNHSHVDYLALILWSVRCISARLPWTRVHFPQYPAMNEHSCELSIIWEHGCVMNTIQVTQSLSLRNKSSTHQKQPLSRLFLEPFVIKSGSLQLQHRVLISITKHPEIMISRSEI